MTTNWQEELDADIRALEVALKREERRGRLFKAMKVEEIQVLIQAESERYARLVWLRKKLLSRLDGGRRMSGGEGGEATKNYVVRHRQEGHIPEGLVTPYEALWIRTYGSGAGYIGDPNALTPTNAGGNQMKMADSGERVHRGVATGSKDRGSSRKSIIKDEKAFDFKRKMDKRMRRMGVEISEWLKSEKVRGMDIVRTEPGDAAVRCDGCQCFVEREWRFCARCGTRRVVNAIAR